MGMSGWNSLRGNVRGFVWWFSGWRISGEMSEEFSEGRMAGACLGEIFRVGDFKGDVRESSEGECPGVCLGEIFWSYRGMFGRDFPGWVLGSLCRIVISLYV